MQKFKYDDYWACFRGECPYCGAEIYTQLGVNDDLSFNLEETYEVKCDVCGETFEVEPTE